MAENFIVVIQLIQPVHCVCLISAQKARKATFRTLIAEYSTSDNDLKWMLWQTIQGHHRQKREIFP